MGCLNYLLEQPGATITMNPHGMASGTLSYKCDRRASCRLASTKMIGPGHTHPRERWLYCSNVVHTNDGAYDIINATYEGLSQDAMPTGGYTLGTIQTAIPLHVNYKDNRPGSFAGPIGEGTSPNTYGRLLDEDGAFKAFGPLPDGLMNRPQPAPDAGAAELEGVENFLQAGQLTFKYGALHKEKLHAKCGPKKEQAQSGRLAKQHIDSVGFVSTPISQSIPYLAPPYEGANWLFVALNEDVKTQNGGNVRFFTTQLEFLASGPGGWNPLLYKDIGATRLP